MTATFVNTVTSGEATNRPAVPIRGFWVVGNIYSSYHNMVAIDMEANRIECRRMSSTITDITEATWDAATVHTNDYTVKDVVFSENFPISSLKLAQDHVLSWSTSTIRMLFPHYNS